MKQNPEKRHNFSESFSSFLSGLSSSFPISSSISSFPSSLFSFNFIILYFLPSLFSSSSLTLHHFSYLLTPFPILLSSFRCTLFILSISLLRITVHVLIQVRSQHFILFLLLFIINSNIRFFFLFIL